MRFWALRFRRNKRKLTAIWIISDNFYLRHFCLKRLFIFDFYYRPTLKSLKLFHEPKRPRIKNLTKEGGLEICIIYPIIVDHILI